ncbi:hypothetical protein Pyn_19630 [Prunus yedoensis var. nudiflora]|uniref:Uncharacterized protein n=1 Tax=Prunus yedoensis var. nudiflora TaxID=2094558 RepID=A0A314YWY7_PRUYE|nr:hypothetical protein Pyn_19630 [Prunus yedoensis var. nudiflora]
MPLRHYHAKLPRHALLSRCTSAGISPHNCPHKTASNRHTFCQPTACTICQPPACTICHHYAHNLPANRSHDLPTNCQRSLLARCLHAAVLCCLCALRTIALRTIALRTCPTCAVEASKVVLHISLTTTAKPFAQLLPHLAMALAQCHGTCKGLTLSHVTAKPFAQLLPHLAMALAQCHGTCKGLTLSHVCLWLALQSSFVFVAILPC